ncbi:MAG TPA: hypothetical protein VFB72_20640 [Verrucomicrobiae bacterium]|nr:hypothetical protein [Verrucomicrobiae bacterium]
MLCSIGLLIFAAISKKASAEVVIEAVALAFSAALIVGGIYGILYLFRHTAFLKKLISFSEAQAEVKEGRIWRISGILTALVAFATFKWVFVLFEYIVICHTYGHDAWAHGLRVISHGTKNGIFSNGDSLDGWPEIILIFGTFVVTALICFNSFLLFRYVGFKLEGRRTNLRKEVDG